MKNFRYPVPSSCQELYLEVHLSFNLPIKRWVIIQRKKDLWQKCFIVEVYLTFLKVRAERDHLL